MCRAEAAEEKHYGFLCGFILRIFSLICIL